MRVNVVFRGILINLCKWHKDSLAQQLFPCVVFVFVSAVYSEYRLFQENNISIKSLVKWLNLALVSTPTFR